MSEDIDSIEWTTEFQLSADNFSGVVNESDPHDANTRSAINYFFNSTINEDKKRYKIKVVKIWVRAYFVPEGSWLRPKILGEINLPKLIKHEQGHFDLAEKCARRFERKLKNKFKNKTFSFNKNLVSDPVNEVKNLIQLEFDMLLEEFTQRTIDYDKATNHGLITNKQEKFDAQFDQLRKK